MTPLPTRFRSSRLPAALLAALALWPLPWLNVVQARADTVGHNTTQSPADALHLEGAIIQGGLVRGRIPPGAQVRFDDQPLLITADGEFLFAFGRDDNRSHRLEVVLPDGEHLQRDFTPDSRDYKIERVDGVPQNTVKPPPELSERIRREAARGAPARQRRDQRSDWRQRFIWPAVGRISGVYGSQRILNGVPARPHYGVDVAAPTGTPVVAPAAGIVTLAEPDLFYSGGTIIIDHGHGLTSTFLHMSAVDVTVGQHLEQGTPIGAIGATGRATGPHLDWRMNWLNQRIDPQLLVPRMETQLAAEPATASPAPAAPDQ